MKQLTFADVQLRFPEALRQLYTYEGGAISFSQPFDEWVVGLGTDGSAWLELDPEEADGAVLANGPSPNDLTDAVLWVPERGWTIR
jgi:hypothetical protein